MQRIEAGWGLRLAGRLVRIGHELACPASGRALDEKALSYDGEVAEYIDL